MFRQVIHPYSIAQHAERRMAEGSRVYIKMNPSYEMITQANEAITLNNLAYGLASNGRNQEALELYKKAVELKVKAHGAVSIQVCISLSGLADAYLELEDYDNAFKEADRMLKIAGRIDDRAQIRIAKEILADIAKRRRQ